MAMILIAIGLFLSSVDFLIAPGLMYPAYIPPKETVGGVTIHSTIQDYVTKNILGGQFQLDILPDAIACIFIVVGACMLVKHNKNYISCVLLALAAGGVSAALRLSPFFINGASLIIGTLTLFLASIVLEIWMEYKLIYTTVSVSDDMANVATNRRMQFGWWITVFARIFAFLLTFVGLSSVRLAYEIVIGVFSVFYVYYFLQSRYYVGTYKIYKEGFNSAILPDYIKEKIVGVSYQENPDISLDDLRYVRILHYDFQGQIQEGELIVNQKIAYATMKVFYQLYKWEYPIERVRLVDDYEGDDELSMEANNSSAFNYRKIAGTSQLSNHALGLAIDLNPRINPYVRQDGFYPVNSQEYLERDPGKCKGEHRDKMIHKNDMAYKIFKRNGFSWGGDWTDSKDYQHFEYRK